MIADYVQVPNTPLPLSVIVTVLVKLQLRELLGLRNLERSTVPELQVTGTSVRLHRYLPQLSYAVTGTFTWGEIGAAPLPIGVMRVRT